MTVADNELTRTVQAFAVSTAEAVPLDAQLGSPEGDTEPESGPPCQGCDVSGLVTVTPR